MRSTKGKKIRKRRGTSRGTTYVPSYSKRSKYGKKHGVSGYHRRLPRKPIRRIILDQGAIRVSEDATESLAIEMELHATKIAERAVKYAQNDNRQTVKDRDIQKAASEYHTSFHKEK